jgi:hypothetical protein
METQKPVKVTPKPMATSAQGDKELDKVQAQFEAFDSAIKDMTLDKMNQAPKLQTEPQAKLSSEQIRKAEDIYLKPKKSIGAPDKFNERFRERWNRQKEYVQFIAQNNEIIGESIEKWTRPFGGIPAEYWEVPVNKPVWGPRYLAEAISSKKYHRFVMENRPVESNGMGTVYGAMAVQQTVQRLDAFPVSMQKTIAMGARSF